MRIQVKLFARARDLVNAEQIELTLNPGATVAELRLALSQQHPQLHPLADRLFIALDEDYANDDAVISEHATIACFPPVSGG